MSSTNRQLTNKPKGVIYFLSAGHSPYIPKRGHVRAWDLSLEPSVFGSAWCNGHGIGHITQEVMGSNPSNFAFR